MPDSKRPEQMHEGDASVVVHVRHLEHEASQCGSSAWITRPQPSRQGTRRRRVPTSVQRGA
jgi:hypothetical protein